MKLAALLRTSLFAILIIPRLLAETPAEWADKHFREQTKGDGPGVAMLVGRDGQILFQGGYGFADVEKKIPITPETKFRIGSVTKQFTAAAILKLAEEGKLATSDPLAKYFPNIPNAEKITLRHLLTHTSGLHSYTERADFFAGVTKPITPADLIASMQKETPDFAPGTKFKYCNSGYFILGEIVAKVSGKSLADYLRSTFFEPLGMKDTGIYVNATPPAGAALGYAVNEGESATPALDWDMSWAGGAGAIYSTVGDLFRWTEALHAGRVVNAESLKAMTSPNPLPGSSDGLNYGFGLVLSNIQRLPAIWHNGGLQGWSSNLVWLPQQKVTLVALANALPAAPAFEPAGVTNALAKHFLADEIAKLPAPAEDKSIDPKSYAAYTGSYDYQNAILKVTATDNRLYAQLTGQEKYEIFPKAPDEFFWKITDASVRFLRNEKGEVIAAQHSQGGNTFRADRLGLDGIKLTPEQLDAYVGQYSYGLLAIMTIKRDGDQLFAQLTGQPAFPIFPTAADRFEWHAVKASVRFVKDDAGKVIKAVHSQNGATFDAPRFQ
ncbi:MAG TPA: serine hydrolase [Chthoniobacter sp.]|jgi:CubicO group peptidase (beta-lactamase class C family)